MSIKLLWDEKESSAWFIYFFYSREKKDETFCAGIDEDGAVRQQWPAPAAWVEILVLAKIRLSRSLAVWWWNWLTMISAAYILFTSTLSSPIPFGCPHLRFLISFFPFTWFEYTIKEDRSADDLYSRVLGWISLVNNRLRSRFGCWRVLCTIREIYYLVIQVTCAITTTGNWR